MHVECIDYTERDVTVHFLKYNLLDKHFIEISAIPRETKNEVCPQGTYETQNFIFKTLIVFAIL